MISNFLKNETMRINWSQRISYFLHADTSLCRQVIFFHSRFGVGPIGSFLPEAQARHSHPCPIHPTRVDSSEALYDSNRFARSRSALPEVNIREITIQEPSSFLKRGNKLQSIRLRHVTIRLDSHAVDPQYRMSTSVK